MADNEVEEESLDEIEEAESKKGFFKSKLFLIIAGVILLIILVGAAYYFFVFAKEAENTELSTDTIENELIEEGENELGSMAEQMGFEDPESLESEEFISAEVTSEDSDKDLIEMQQENLRMKQQVNELEAKLSQIEKAIQQQKDTTNSTNNAMPLHDQNSLGEFQQNFDDTSSMREPNATPPPKPNWGEFDRLKKK